MDWKKEMKEIEKRGDWIKSIQLLNKVTDKKPEIHLRVIFLLLDFLVDGKYEKEEHDFAAAKLKDIFNHSKLMFSEDAEFGFFIGIMIYIAEWYFGLDDLDYADTMLKKAINIDSNNSLYKWGYISTIDQRLEVNRDLKLQLSKQLLLKEPSKIDWLNSKGLLGSYVLGILENTYKSLKI